jgi:hypothetical protein
LKIKDWKTEIVHPLLKKYTSLKAQGLWPTAVNHTEIQGLQAKIAALEARLNDGDSGGSNSQNSRNNAGAGMKREPFCWKCGEKGHKKSDCPKSDESGSGRPPVASNNGRAQPKDGESHTRTRDNVVEKWCGRCRRWTRGDKAHLTDEHVSKKQGVTQAASAITEEDDRSYEGESYLMRTRLYHASFDKDTPDVLSWCDRCEGFKPVSHTCEECHPKGCAGQLSA